MRIEVPVAHRSQHLCKGDECVPNEQKQRDNEVDKFGFRRLDCRGRYGSHLKSQQSFAKCGGENECVFKQFQA